MRLFLFTSFKVCCYSLGCFRSFKVYCQAWLSQVFPKATTTSPLQRFKCRVSDLLTQLCVRAFVVNASLIVSALEKVCGIMQVPTVYLAVGQNYRHASAFNCVYSFMLDAKTKVPSFSSSQLMLPDITSYRFTCVYKSVLHSNILPPFNSPRAAFVILCAGSECVSNLLRDETLVRQTARCKMETHNEVH